jgi:DNA-binding NarL/FixJ family response regulator
MIIILIDGMRTLLNTVSNFEVIGFRRHKPYDDVTTKANILILDISMPKKDGIE